MQHNSFREYLFDQVTKRCYGFIAWDEWLSDIEIKIRKISNVLNFIASIDCSQRPSSSRESGALCRFDPPALTPTLAHFQPCQIYHRMLFGTSKISSELRIKLLKAVLQIRRRQPRGPVTKIHNMLCKTLQCRWDRPCTHENTPQSHICHFTICTSRAAIFTQSKRSTLALWYMQRQ